MVVPCTVEPRLVSEARHVDDERLPFPVAARPTHPRIRRALLLAVHPDDAAGARELVRDEQVRPPGRLHDLEWIGHVGRARDSRQITFDLRVSSHPVCRVFSFFCQRLRPIRNVVAFDDAQSAGHTERRAERDDGALARLVGLDVPISRVIGFPDSVQIGFAVCHARRSSRRWRLSRRRRADRKGGNHCGHRTENYGSFRPVSHAKSPVAPGRWSHNHPKPLALHTDGPPQRPTSRERYAAGLLQSTKKRVRTFTPNVNLANHGNRGFIFC